MMLVRQTGEFRDWLMALRDGIARARIASRIRRLEDGNFGDVKPLGGGLSEMRVHHGAGYRLYFVTQGRVVIVLLCGGDKGTQAQDIKRARALAAMLEG